jgi:hypothetical protein
MFRRFVAQLSLVLCMLWVVVGCAGLNHYATGPVAAGPPPGAARVYFALPQGFPKAQAYVVEAPKLLGNQHE